jgi:cytochrome c2
LKAKSAESWTEASLDAFFTDAQAFAPGTMMTVIMPNAQERADIIAYLASLPPPQQ